MKNKKIIFVLLLLVILAGSVFLFNILFPKFPCSKTPDGISCAINTCKFAKCVRFGKCMQSKCLTFEEYDKSINVQFKNDYFEMSISPGWNYQELGNGTVNITKNNYVLYINPNASQASGIIGGRFSEIAQGTSADLVLKMHPSEPCGSSTTYTLTDKLKIVDFYINPQNNQPWCNSPQNGNLWYFSYVTTNQGGYFGDSSIFNPSDSARKQFVITISYKTSEIDKLPYRGFDEYERARSEMIKMLKTFSLK